MIEADLEQKGLANGPVPANARPEYGKAYRELANRQEHPKPPVPVEAILRPPDARRHDIMILGSAGQRVITAGELLGIAAMSAGLHVTQKNDYDITVLRGPSISELILAPGEIDYPEIVQPSVILALAPEGVARRSNAFAGADKDALVIRASDVDIPETKAKIRVVDFKQMGLRAQDWAVAALAVLATMQTVIDGAMLETALTHRFRGNVLDAAKAVVHTAMSHSV